MDSLSHHQRDPGHPGPDNTVVSTTVRFCIHEGKIADLGPTPEVIERNPDAPVRIDARGKVVLPGFICAHHHLYSSMARGFAPPGEPAFTFGEILERLWWKLDRALDSEDVRYSALIALTECIRNGTTTIIDHHASPSCRDGSLDLLAEAALQSGIRASLCYEVSDRNEPGAGVAECSRFLERLSRETSDRLHGMVGLHASFTVSDETLARCREVAERFEAGYHIHVAEGVEDHQDALDKYGVRTVQRLVDRGICGDRSLFIHCINVDDAELELIAVLGHHGGPQPRVQHEQRGGGGPGAGAAGAGDPGGAGHRRHVLGHAGPDALRLPGPPAGAARSPGGLLRGAAGCCSTTTLPSPTASSRGLSWAC